MNTPERTPIRPIDEIREKSFGASLYSKGYLEGIMIACERVRNGDCAGDLGFTDEKLNWLKDEKLINYICMLIKKKAAIEVYDNSYESAEWIAKKLNLEEAVVWQWLDEADVTEWDELVRKYDVKHLWKMF